MPAFLADVRSKLLPALLEWDMLQQGRREAGEDGDSEVRGVACLLEQLH